MQAQLKRDEQKQPITQNILFSLSSHVTSVIPKLVNSEERATLHTKKILSLLRFDHARQEISIAAFLITNGVNGVLANQRKVGGAFE
jgi:hypothetical protein